MYSIVWPSSVQPRGISSFLRRVSAIRPSVPLLNMPLAQALEHSKRYKKPLTVFLISEPTTERYIHEIICSDFTENFLSTHFLGWGWDLSEVPNRPLTELLFVNNLPCVAVLGVDHMNRPLLLDKLEGEINVDTYNEFLVRNLNHFAMLGTTNTAYEQERAIREQQEREYKEAERVTLEAQQREQERGLRLKMELEEKEHAEQERERAIQEKIRKLGEEPEEGVDSAKLSIRLPNGEKTDRRFLRTDEVGVLYDFVDTLRMAVPYELVTSFPAKVMADRTSTLEEEGLFPRAVIHIREIISE